MRTPGWIVLALGIVLAVLSADAATSQVECHDAPRSEREMLDRCAVELRAARMEFLQRVTIGGLISVALALGVSALVKRRADQ